MSRGFTLIELLITTVISGILIGGGLAAYRGLGTKQQVKQAGAELVANLKNYQQKALAGQKPAECGGSDTLTGYRARYVDEDTYSVKAVCQVNNPAAASIDLPNAVTFSAAFNPMNIVFPVLGGDVTGAQTITLVKDTYSYQIVIETSGVIRGQML